MMTRTARTPGTLLLVRHGQTAWSAVGRHTGLTDLPLDDEGTAQAAALTPLIAHHAPTLTWSSPLQRAVQTAELAGAAPTALDDQLEEWDYGGYDGLTSDQISERLGRPWSLWRDGVVPGDTPGETLEQVAARCRAVVRRVLPQVLGGATVALVAHGHLLRVLATAWLDVNPDQGALLALGPATLSTLTFEQGQHVIGTWNVAPRFLTG